MHFKNHLEIQAPALMQRVYSHANMQMWSRYSVYLAECVNMIILVNWNNNKKKVWTEILQVFGYKLKYFKMCYLLVEL